MLSEQPAGLELDQVEEDNVKRVLARPWMGSSRVRVRRPAEKRAGFRESQPSPPKSESDFRQARLFHIAYVPSFH